MDTQAKQQKISIVLATYNDADSLPKAIKAIFELDYPKELFELIVVDDGSTDDTYDILNEYQKRAQSLGVNYLVHRLKANSGRIIARLEGVKHAQHGFIVIADSRGEPDRTFLQKLNQYLPESSVISNYYMDKKRSWMDRVFYLIRKWYYRPYWGTTFDNVQITKENFNKISKGTGGFATMKRDFIRFSEYLLTNSRNAKETNEDTKLFRAYIDAGRKLIRVYDAKMLYTNRTGLAAFIHLFKRGPRFVDYYVMKSFRMKILLLFALFSTILMFIASFVWPLSAVLVVLALLSLDAFVSVYLAEELGDFLPTFVILPAIVVSFYLGVLNGLRVHLFRGVEDK